MAILATFLLIGIYQPFLAGEVALVWRDAAGWSLPVLGDLFNRRSYGRPHELVFNVVALALPFLVVTAVVLRRWRYRTVTVVGLLMVAVTVAVPCWQDRPLASGTRDTAATASLVLLPPVPFRADTPVPGSALLPPGSRDPASGARFWLGTDSAGKDVAAQMIAGARVSLTIGVVATGLSLVIGTLIGAISGFVGGWVDLLLQRLVEIMMCFPTFILVLVVVAMLGRDIFLIMLVIGLTGWAGTARLVRGAYLAESVKDYVTAGTSLGLSRSRIMFRHILPNACAPLLISATFGVAGAVLAESGLSFIGLGDPTLATWGTLLEQGRENIHYPWLIYLPGLAVFLLITALNQIGNGLREAFDPRHA
jgi:peptide/nickel transport system permease protein